MEGREGKWESSLKSHDSTSEQRSAVQCSAVQCASGAAKDEKGSGLVCWIHHPAQPPRQVQSSIFTLALSQRARVR